MTSIQYKVNEHRMPLSIEWINLVGYNCHRPQLSFKMDKFYYNCEKFVKIPTNVNSILIEMIWQNCYQCTLKRELENFLRQNGRCSILRSRPATIC